MTAPTRCRRQVDITAEAGLHARPAAGFAATAARFAADVRVGKAATEVDGKSVLLLLTLDARRGDRLTITADGPDAEEAVEALARVVAP